MLLVIVTIFYANNSDITGHTSASGTEEYNQFLSIKRAQSVANKLVSQFKIDRNIIHVIGRGETELTSNIPSENRRIEVKLHETVRQPIMR